MTYVVIVMVVILCRNTIWACAKTPLTQFDRGDHMMRTPMRTPMHTLPIPDAYPNEDPHAVIAFIPIYGI